MTRKEFVEKMKKEVIEGELILPNGCSLVWITNSQGCREYYSNECGVDVQIWDTTIIDDSTLLAVLTQEATLRRAEIHLSEENARNK